MVSILSPMKESGRVAKVRFEAGLELTPRRVIDRLLLTGRGEEVKRRTPEGLRVRGDGKLAAEWC